MQLVRFEKRQIAIPSMLRMVSTFVAKVALASKVLVCRGMKIAWLLSSQDCQLKSSSILYKKYLQASVEETREGIQNNSSIL
jgi:hypothetical protein